MRVTSLPVRAVLAPRPTAVHRHHALQRVHGDLAAHGVRGVAVSVEQGVALLWAGEGLEDLPAGHGGAEREKPAGEQFGVDGDVGVDLEERRRGSASETVQTGEDLVEDDRQARPGRFGLRGGDRRKQVGVIADDVGKTALEERVAVELSR